VVVASDENVWILQAGKGPIFKMPRSVGCDFAGVVAAVGEGAMVTAMDGSRRAAAVGDEVFGDGIAGTGSFAEFVSVMSNQAVLKPAELSFAEVRCRFSTQFPNGLSSAAWGRFELFLSLRGS
jgi:NADPH:quinone reductase-like Zn-dependent oxidoreductase